MTWALILFSYCSNYIPIGAAIMLVHDMSDLPVTILKLCVDTTTSLVEYATFTTLFSSWIFFRLYVFPFKIVLRMIEECYYQTIVGMNY